MYDAFAASGGDLTKATVFLLDEFGLPSGSSGRCDTMIQTDFINKLAAPPGVFNTWDTESDDLAAVAATMDAALSDGGLDLMILGIGSNGHLGLNEPGTQRDTSSRRVDLHPNTIAAAQRYGATVLPTWGMTFGMATVMGARRVWLLATGHHKARIVASALTGSVGPDITASFLQDHSSLTVMLDEDAASLL